MDTVGGASVDVAFDAGYLLDAIRGVADDTEIHVELNSGDKPVMFYLGEGWRHMVMPLCG